MTDIFELSSRAVDEFAAADPIKANDLGIPGFDAQWTDLSPDGHGQRRDLASRFAVEASGFAVGSTRERLAQQVLVDYCTEAIDLVDSGDHLAQLNNLASPLQDIRTIFERMPTASTEQWEAIATRLETINAPLDGYRACLEAGRIAGETVARRQVAMAIEQSTAAAGPNSSFTKLDYSAVTDAALRRRLEAGIETAQQGYDQLARYLKETYMPAARPEDPVGRDRYQRAARRYLGSDIDLEETYRWGWEEVERLTADLGGLCREIDPYATPAEIMVRLHTDPEMAANSLDEFIELMQQRQQHALHELDGTHFAVPEEIRTVDVRVEPAGGALAAHYTNPSEDLSRPGIVWYPVEGRDFFPLYQEITIAYHEGFPGHHLQIGIQGIAREQLSRFHQRFVWYPGAGEGWALYAEGLMSELGYLERPEYQIGYVTSQLFRSCRIAIDIGAHLGLPIPDDVSFHAGEPWSFDLAVELLTERGTIDSDFAVDEVVRYLGWPGQAISYKVGERAIAQLRAEASGRPDFDIKAFHSELLGYGAVGLDLLSELMLD